MQIDLKHNFSWIISTMERQWVHFFIIQIFLLSNTAQTNAFSVSSRARKRAAETDQERQIQKRSKAFDVRTLSNFATVIKSTDHLIIQHFSDFLFDFLSLDLCPEVTLWEDQCFSQETERVYFLAKWGRISDYRASNASIRGHSWNLCDRLYCARPRRRRAFPKATWWAEHRQGEVWCCSRPSYHNFLLK